MNIKDLQKELEKVQDEAQKKEMINSYAEKKVKGCGRSILFIFIILIMLAVMLGLVALLKLLIGFIF